MITIVRWFWKKRVEDYHFMSWLATRLHKNTGYMVYGFYSKTTKKPSGSCRWLLCSAMNLFFEELSALDVVDHLRQAVDLFFGIVEGERWPYGALHTEAPQ
jgi:hypothetical protein